MTTSVQRGEWLAVTVGDEETALISPSIREVCETTIERYSQCSSASPLLLEHLRCHASFDTLNCVVPRSKLGLEWRCQRSLYRLHGRIFPNNIPGLLLPIAERSWLKPSGSFVIGWL